MTLAADPALATGFERLTVRRVERLCTDAVAVEFAERRSFTAGQSLTVRRVVDGIDCRRSYSICAAEGEALRIGVREVPGGAVSSWLTRELRAGDRVEVAGPSGRFTLVDPTAHHLCVAAGSGITPVVSIAATALAAGGSVTLLYGNRSAASGMFTEEIADLKDAHLDRFHLVHLLSREPRTPEIFSGRLDAERLALLLNEVAAVRFDHAWLCGPLPMVETARSVLTDHALPSDRIHAELFFVDEPPPPPARVSDRVTTGGVEVEVVLEGRRTRAVVGAGVPVLDGAQMTRADLPFACKGGVCGTCRARVVEGVVEMRRNYALDDAEVAAGFVLTCQAVPTSERVVIDFDT